jgi:hypothetical protein
MSRGLAGGPGIPPFARHHRLAGRDRRARGDEAIYRGRSTTAG